MKKLKTIPMHEGGTCRSYLFELAETAARLAGRNDAERKKAEIAALSVIDTSAPGMLSPLLANRMLGEIARITGNADPYADFKIEEMIGARKAFEEIKKQYPKRFTVRRQRGRHGQQSGFFPACR